MNRFLLPLLVALLSPGALVVAAPGADAAEVQAGALHISGAFARATPPRAPVGGAYLTIANEGAEADRLVSASVAIGREVQIHEMTESAGVASMRELADGLAIPAGGTVTLAPGGTHLMLVGLSEGLVQGTVLPVVLHFEKAGDVTVPFDVLPMNARGPAGAAAPGGTGHDRHGMDGHGMNGHGMEGHGMDHGAQGAAGAQPGAGGADPHAGHGN